MNNLILGIITFSVCVILGYIGLRYYGQKKYDIVIILILLIGISLRIYISTDRYLHTWDERYHALVAKNLIKHPLKPTLYDNPLLPYNYKDWTENNIWLEKGPIPLWFMSASVYLFGCNDFAVRIPSLIISLLSIYLTFLIGSRLFDKRIGLLAAFFHSINGLIIEVAGGRISSDHVETFFIFFIELALFISILLINQKKNFWVSALIGIATGLALLTKWSPALIVFPIWIITELIRKSKSLKNIFLHLIIALLTCFIIAFPWIWYIDITYHTEATWVFKKFIFAYTETIESHRGPFYYYFQILFMVFGEIIWIPIIFSIYHLLKKKTDWRMGYLNLWWILPFIIFSFASTKRATYLLLAAPAFFIIASYYWFYISDIYVKRNRWIYVVLILLIVLPIRYSIERTKIFTIRGREKEWAVKLKSMKDKFDNKTVFFNYEHAIEGMYYTDYTFYTYLPDKNKLDSLKNKGYKIIINENKNRE